MPKMISSQLPRLPRKAKGKGKQWLATEKEELCVSWVNTSIDPVKGSDQKLKTYWSRIHECREMKRE
ncbi:uncharacterized protein B0P05DRAFT_534479 [Gilbertella persicaria]|uniref:uncharacterized protein n=1 Tax=Gilbertella persicaria TaxID=101096 RepID=UPI002220BA6F|nr:uncharacterized protein B0P05DRAFT_534479 [Gilbertella persicaria]KAI8084178.1 hypothetical protein B0P05DRAFT_534479 [Gilbertella persicaria]